jgi:adenosylcobinamide kinase / adenosylcobinamide-phosphate guanylyltransferase
MGKITFIMGGARSGKSAFALELANESERVAFIASCQPLDKEMKKRIGLHRKARPVGWKTFEESLEISRLLKQIANKFDLLLIDCLTLFLCNLMLKGFSQKKIEDEMNEILSILEKTKAGSIIISNEVGLGIVPRNKLSRDFRDTQGRINQLVARKASRVFFIAAGIPFKIKDAKYG